MSFHDPALCLFHSCPSSTHTPVSKNTCREFFEGAPFRSRSRAESKSEATPVRGRDGCLFSSLSLFFCYSRHPSLPFPLTSQSAPCGRARYGVAVGAGVGYGPLPGGVRPGRLPRHQKVMTGRGWPKWRTQRHKRDKWPPAHGQYLEYLDHRSKLHWASCRCVLLDALTMHVVWGRSLDQIVFHIPVILFFFAFF